MTDYISREAAEKVFSQPVTMSMCLTLEECKQKNAQRQIDLFVIRGLPAADVRPKWISVEEQKPKAEKCSYWCYTDAGIMCECRWTNNRYGLGASDEWGWSIFDVPQYQKVTHWMPLPEPPEEVEK